MAHARTASLVGGLLLILALASPAAAEIVSVTVYPGSAQVSEKASLALSRGATGAATASLTLPAAADPQSLTLKLPAERSLIDLSFESVERTDQAKVAEVKAQVEAARTARDQLKAKVDSLAAQLGFWKTLTPGEAPDPSGAAKLAETLGASVEKAATDLAALQKPLAEREKALKDLEDKLAALVGRAEKVWQVALAVSGPVSGQMQAEYEYSVGGCGWSPVYRLNARPGEKVVELGFRGRGLAVHGRGLADPRAPGHPAPARPDRAAGAARLGHRPAARAAPPGQGRPGGPEPHDHGHGGRHRRRPAADRARARAPHDLCRLGPGRAPRGRRPQAAPAHLGNQARGRLHLSHPPGGERGLRSCARS